MITTIRTGSISAEASSSADKEQAHAQLHRGSMDPFGRDRNRASPQPACARIGAQSLRQPALLRHAGSAREPGRRRARLAEDEEPRAGTARARQRPAPRPQPRARALPKARPRARPSRPRARAGGTTPPPSADAPAPSRPRRPTPRPAAPRPAPTQLGDSAAPPSTARGTRPCAAPPRRASPPAPETQPPTGSPASRRRSRHRRPAPALPDELRPAQRVLEQHPAGVVTVAQRRQPRRREHRLEPALEQRQRLRQGGRRRAGSARCPRSSSPRQARP